MADSLTQDPSVWSKMFQQSQGLDTVDPDLGDISALAAMTPEPAPVKGPWSTKVTKTVKIPSQAIPNQANADMLELVKQYNQKQKENLAAQGQGVQDLAGQVQAIQAQPGTPDVRALASFYGLQPGAFPAGETTEQRSQRLLGLQMELQKARQGLSKEQADTLKDQIMAVKATKDTGLQDALTIAKTNAFNNVGGRQQSRLDEQNYAAMIQDVKKDPILKQNLTPYANLSNALDNVTSPDKTPVQQLNELQQTIRGSTGLRGKSGIAERNEDYIKMFGSNASSVLQYLSGKVTNVPDGIKQEIVKHLGQIVEVEKKNLERQSVARFDQLTGGQTRILKRNPQMKADLEQFRKEYLDSLKAMASQENAGAAAAPAVGAISQGYKFLGGDPSSKDSWEKQ